MPHPNLAEFSREIAEIVGVTSQAVAAVDLGRSHTSSAVHWRDGLFIASNEAVDHADVALILPSGDRAEVEVAGRDPSTGIVLLRSEKQNGAAALKPASPVMAGSLAIVTGRASQGPVVGFGIVAEAGPVWRSMRGGLIDRRIRLSANVDPRAEGGAAVDAEGDFIGLVLFGPDRRPLVIPAETIERAASVLADKGHVPRGYLGVGLHPVRHAQVRGAMVMSLEEGSPAQSAGLVIGDIITSWDNDKIEGVRDLMRHLGSDSVGANISLGIVRGGEARGITVTVGERPRR
jgi:S1-C subfamily serine protease